MSLRAWSIAIAASLLLHLGLMAFLADRPEEVQMAGGTPGEIALLGNAFENAVAEGSIEAVAAETAQAIEAEPGETVEAETLEARPLERIDPDSTLVAIPAEPVETEVAEQMAKIEAMTTEEIVQAPPNPPARPAEIVAPRPQPQPVPARAGGGGAAQGDSQQGVAQGSQAGTTASTGTGASDQAGNRATSNYPGQVAAALSRALRYPPNGRGATGEVYVRFTIAASGQVTAMQVARSSGNTVLDQAALATISRAAPFPPIPPEAGRSDWTFTLPLAFLR